MQLCHISDKKRRARRNFMLKGDMQETIKDADFMLKEKNEYDKKCHTLKLCKGEVCKRSKR